ncbi:MAG: CDP-alcohol phosphatidyltransferase family protein [Patescibacteria group bacterium]
MKSFTLAEIKSFQKPHDSIFSTLITRKLSRVFTFVLLELFPNISPNTVSMTSMLINLAAAACLFSASYWTRIIGVVLLQIGFVFDCSDGEVARATGKSSPFGGFLDSTFDRVKEIIVLGALTHHLASHVALPFGWTPIYALILGASAVLGLQLVSYIREAKKAAFPKTRTSEIYITKSIYLGTVDLFVYSVTFAVIFQLEYWLLWGFALISIPLILKQIRGAYILSKAEVKQL